MAINASASSQPRQLPPAGTHVARCYSIIDMGTREKIWQDKKRRSHEIRISWELCNELHDFGKGQEEPYSVHKNYTLSLSEKANLRHDLEAWRSKPFSDEELARFDVCKVLGAACMVTVTHVTKGDAAYANVTAVTGMPKGMQAPALVNPLVEYSISEHDQTVFDKLPDFMKEIIRGSDEWKERSAPSADPEPDQTWDGDAPGDDTSVPF